MDSSSAAKPTRMVFEILSGKKLYEYSFSVTQEAVMKETLIQIRSSSEKTLYTRNCQNMKFDNSLKEKDRLVFVSEGTRPNQLLLTNSVSQNVKAFKPIHNWFRNNLRLLRSEGPSIESQLNSPRDEKEVYAKLNEILPQLDLGIDRLGMVSMSYHANSLPDFFPEGLKKYMKQAFQKGVQGIFIDHSSGEPKNLRVTKEKGKLILKNKVAFHNCANGKEVQLSCKRVGRIKEGYRASSCFYGAIRCGYRKSLCH